MPSRDDSRDDSGVVSVDVPSAALLFIDRVMRRVNSVALMDVKRASRVAQTDCDRVDFNVFDNFVLPREPGRCGVDGRVPELVCGRRFSLCCSIAALSFGEVEPISFVVCCLL